ncbi:PA domain-containing protein, partial [Streptomyces fragilis]
MRRRRAAAAVTAAAALTAPLLLAASPAADREDPGGAKDPAAAADALAARLVRHADAQDAYRHLAAFQRIADAHGGNRAAGTPGGDATAAYLRKALQRAGYRVTTVPFAFTYAEALAEKLGVTVPGTSPRDIDVALMTYTVSTPEGGLTAPLAALPAGSAEGDGTPDGTPGCEPSDYATRDVKGKAVLIPRGACSFAAKQKAAATAGAVAALIVNNADGPLRGTLGDPSAAAIPTGGVTREDGKALAAAAAKAGTTVTLDLRERREKRTAHNVIAETRGGDPSRTVMAGA